MAAVNHLIVIPAKAGTQNALVANSPRVPAFVGMTLKGQVSP
jgi:hypothetical protein